ncbi:hypothetical protein Ae201684P_019746 [Aphanomyces euteiches]|nr:hypothetical protein Ae201684P_019746 [Aphanomyces euteiches]
MAAAWAWMISLFLCSLVVQGEFVQKLLATTRCSPLSTSSACVEYERCKATHRCASGDEEYTIAQALLQVFDEKFRQGERVQVQLVNDFEDWKTGVHHWSVPFDWQSPIAFGFDTFSLPLLGSLELDRGTLYIDTSAGTMSGDVAFQGEMLETPQRTTVAVFNFLTVYLGSRVNVVFKGNQAFALLSRSSMVLNTHLEAPPGSLGGFSGGGTLSQYNHNGPGSSNVRVYEHTVTTSALLQPTVQEIQTSAAPGQTLRGTFTLSSATATTTRLSFDATAAQVKAQVENALGIGLVDVQRLGQDAANVGRIWRITFSTAIGNAPLLSATSYLTGLQANVTARLVTRGNQLSGGFRLSFLTKTTRLLSYNISQNDLQAELRDAFDIKSAQVVKMKASTIERGNTWKIRMTTSNGNKAPTSPSSPVAIEPLNVMTASTFDTVMDPITGQTTSMPLLFGQNAVVTISATAAYSIASGGTGGVYLPTNDLVGGSGGGGGGESPADFKQYPRPIYGGAGGGAMYFGAVNDMTIGPNASIAVDGQRGEDGVFAGGGGSGGSLFLTSGTSVHILGVLSAQGGAGGSSLGRPGASGTGGKIALTAHAMALSGHGTILASPNGNVELKLQTQLQITTDPFVGAAQTAKSLYIAKSIVEPTPMLEGPRFTFYADQPTRISYFVRLGDVQQGTLATNRGALFGVHHSSDPSLFILGIGMLHGNLVFDSNCRGFPLQTLVPRIHAFQWYQVDIFINWSTKLVEIRVNGVSMASNIAFLADAVDMVGLYSYDAMQTWWDELYVGFDHTMGFHCPEFDQNNVFLDKQRVRPLWNPSIVGPQTQFGPKVRHESQVSRRRLYQYNNGGLVPNDGPAHRLYFNDIQDSTVYDRAVDEIHIGMGEIIKIAMAPDASMVFPLETNVEGVSTRWTASPAGKCHQKSSGQVVRGGIGACSTMDMKTWRNEGIMLHYANLTDPFGENTNFSMLATRPKVVFNQKSRQFVMWMHVDSKNNDMGLSGVATADFPNGPFEFQTSFYPSSTFEAPGGQAINQTFDQTVVVFPSQDAYLVQSYYKTVEYWLPRPVMDPLWESVKRDDGTVDFGLNYHRAFFLKDYDNVDDIYLQRFRSEDTPWSITCCHRVTNLCDASVLVNNQGCPPQYRKQVNGQAQDNKPILTRYKDPHSAANNAFKANSVPSHTDWGFQVYNIKTWRGNYFDALSANITLLMFKIFAGMASVYDIPSSLEVTYPPGWENATYINATDPPDVMDFMLDTIGVPLTPKFKRQFDAFDLSQMDLNSDGKLTLDEVADLIANGKQSLSVENYDKFLVAFEALKIEEKLKMDPNNDGKITYREFENWVGLDPALVFDRFDLDKSGYLDENELSRLLMDRQLPRLDSIAILLDPDFDGRVYYEMFESFIFNASTVIFLNYDFDHSNDLNASEIELMESDIGVSFLNTSVLLPLVNASRIQFDTYSTWMTASASALRDRVQAFKVDNGLHPTRPDRMTGPLHVVEQRRAKYLSIAKLTPDFMATEQVIVEMEGDFDGHGSLLNIAEFVLQMPLPPSSPAILPYRQFLAPVDFGHYATYWNGRAWEPRPSAPAHFTYGVECDQLANPNCLPCAAQSPYATSSVQQYQNVLPTLSFCENDKAIDAYLKQFDQQVSITLRYQQVARTSSAGVQPQYSPCVNQSESVPCDVNKVYETDMHTPYHLEWEARPNNKGTSVKIRAGPMQQSVVGQTFRERFPNRVAEPPYSMCVINSTQLPDQYGAILGGG